MSRAHPVLTRFAAAFLFLCSIHSGTAGPRGSAERGVPLPPFAKLKPGLTPEQVRRMVGAPKHVARQILYHRYREQWIYDAPTPVRLTFDCPRGQKPQLLLIPGLSERAEP
jgi:hypothetical protein